MYIFAMDTSSVTATVAVITEEKLLGEYSVSNRLTHSQTILPMADELLKNLELELKDIDVFSVCTGPGSFTGLRIGMATVKTMAQALSKPIIGVSSLDALGLSFYTADDTVVCPIVDARRQEVYNALYSCGSKICDDRALNIDTLLCELRGKKVVFCGDAAILHKDKIEGTSGENWKIAPQHLILPKASSAAYAALKRAEESSFDDPCTLNPVYLRKSQAERELEERINGGNK